MSHWTKAEACLRDRSIFFTEAHHRRSTPNDSRSKTMNLTRSSCGSKRGKVGPTIRNGWSHLPRSASITFMWFDPQLDQIRLWACFGYLLVFFALRRMSHKKIFCMTRWNSCFSVRYWRIKLSILGKLQNYVTYIMAILRKLPTIRNQT